MKFVELIARYFELGEVHLVPDGFSCYDRE
jgi:hypothetical protein